MDDYSPSHPTDQDMEIGNDTPPTPEQDANLNMAPEAISSSVPFIFGNTTGTCDSAATHISMPESINIQKLSPKIDAVTDVVENKQEDRNTKDVKNVSNKYPEKSHRSSKNDTSYSSRSSRRKSRSKSPKRDRSRSNERRRRSRSRSNHRNSYSRRRSRSRDKQKYISHTPERRSDRQDTSFGNRNSSRSDSRSRPARRFSRFKDDQAGRDYKKDEEPEVIPWKPSRSYDSKTDDHIVSTETAATDVSVSEYSALPTSTCDYVSEHNAFPPGVTTDTLLQPHMSYSSSNWQSECVPPQPYYQQPNQNYGLHSYSSTSYSLPQNSYQNAIPMPPMMIPPTMPFGVAYQQPSWVPPSGYPTIPPLAPVHPVLTTEPPPPPPPGSNYLAAPTKSNLLETLMSQAGLTREALSEPHAVPNEEEQQPVTSESEPNSDFNPMGQINKLLSTAAISVLHKLKEARTPDAPPPPPPIPTDANSANFQSSFVPPPLPSCLETYTSDNFAPVSNTQEHALNGSKKDRKAAGYRRPFEGQDIKEVLLKKTRYDFADKKEWQDRIALEVKSVLKPAFLLGRINKEDYKEIMKKSVTKIFRSGASTINAEKISDFVKLYVEKYHRNRKLKSRLMSRQNV